MASFIPLIFVLGLGFLIFRLIAAKKTCVAKYICTTCGTSANPITHTKGSLAIELILWLFLLIPGLIYSVWRLTSKEQVCPSCKKPSMIPLNSPAGQKYAREFATCRQQD